MCKSYHNKIKDFYTKHLFMTICFHCDDCGAQAGDYCKEWEEKGACNSREKQYFNETKNYKETQDDHTEMGLINCKS